MEAPLQPDVAHRVGYEPTKHPSDAHDVPWVVTDSKGVEVGQQTPILGRFLTEDEAATWINTLPEHETGRYGLCGPPDDEDRVLYLVTVQRTVNVTYRVWATDAEDAIERVEDEEAIDEVDVTVIEEHPLHAERE